MQSERIYSAPSLRDVAQQLLIYRPTGVLSLWPATTSRQDEMRIIVEYGRLARVYWGGANQEDINETTLNWLNTWGEIHFSFVSTESRLPLPSPSRHAPTLQPQQPGKLSLPQSTSNSSQRLPQQPAVTRPQSALTYTNRNGASPTDKTRAISDNQIPNGQFAQAPHVQEQRQVYGHSHDRPAQHPDLRQTPLTSDNKPLSIRYASVVATLTASGQSYPAVSLPRYERTIFLLLNGRRSVVDLAQLTNRPYDEVYITLQRLQLMQLITISTLPATGNR